MTDEAHEAVVLSDLHIGNGYKTCWYQAGVHDPYLTAALRWIVARKDTIREVILLGDIFDVWTYPPTMTPPTMQQIVDANPVLLGRTGPFAALVKAFPHRVRLMLGNHDGTLTRQDVATLNRALGGDTARGEAIGLTECPVLVLRSGTAATTFSHGHHWCMFNAPDTASPWNTLPVGHLVSRAIAHKWERDLPAGKTVADLPSSGNDLDQKRALGQFIETLLRKGGDDARKRIVALLFEYIRGETGMKADDPIALPDGRSTTTMAQAERTFADIWARWAGAQGRALEADRAAMADAGGAYLSGHLAWFAQRVGLQATGDLVVLGHTHRPVRRMQKSPVNYVNNGYGCVSIPDRRTSRFTFTLVDLRAAKAQLYKVVPAAGGAVTVAPAKDAEAEVLGPVVPPAVDYSCYVRIRNDTARRLTLASAPATDGYWAVPPPQEIPPGATVHAWLQDLPGRRGSDGAIEYRARGARWPLHFEVACPVVMRNRVVSPVPDWQTSADGARWRDREVVRGNPMLVRFTVGRRLPEEPDPEQAVAAAHADYIALGRLILAAMRADSYRGEVMTHVHLVAADGNPLLDTATEASGRGRIRLQRPPAHVVGPDVFRVTSPLYGQFDYVLMHPAAATDRPAVGGFLFLPADGSPNLNLVSYNVRKLEQSYKEACRNTHHAEIQITNWIEQQAAAWQHRLGRLSLTNASRSGRVAYSPCNACCDDLAHFLTTLNARHGRTTPCLARAAWSTRYVGNARCHHPTERSGIDKLRAAGWKLPKEPLPGLVLPDSAVAKAGDPQWHDGDPTR